MPDALTTVTAFEESGDGYDYIQQLEVTGKWAAVGSWGLDGWDLGDWPYLVYFVSKQGDQFCVRERCEGDLTTWTFATRAEMIAKLDETFWWCVRNHPDRMGWTEPPADLETNPRYRGPFSWDRLNKETPA